MKNLNDAFLEYNDLKRIRKPIYDEMKEHIDTIVQEIRDNSETKSFSTLYLGSYATKTGVEYKDKDYDIDIAIRINIKEAEINKFDAKQQKLSIYNAIKKLRDKKFRNMCVSANYYEDEKPKYHIDFPIYAYDDEKDVYFIAKGKLGKVIWERCEPKKLIEYLVFSEAQQEKIEAYQRVIRYLKLWKNKVFSTEPEYSCPPSIAINLTARQTFNSLVISDEIDNLILVTKNLQKQISANATLYLPYIPYSNVYEKMNSNPNNIVIYSKKINDLIENLQRAKETSKYSLEETCKLLNKVFPDFPLPKKEDVEESFTPSGSYGK